MKRLFLALPLTTEAKTELTAAQNALSPDLPGAKWVSPEGMHMSLKFLGPVNYDLLREGIFLATRKAVRQQKAFDFSLDGLGAFPSEKRPRVVWAGVADEGQSKRLAVSLEEALYVLGFPLEGREFTPHITLARIKTTRIIDNPDLFTSYGGLLKKTRICASAVILYESVLKREGAQYFEVERFELS